MTGIEDHIVQFIRNVYDTVGWPGLVAMMVIESACIPLPSEIIMPLAGWFLIRDHGHGVQWVFLAAFLGALGNVIGSWIAYTVGAYGGRPFLRRYGRYVLITSHDVDRSQRWFERYGDRVVLISRLLPVVRTFISLPAGIARMDLLKFSVLTFIGSFPFSLGLAYGGFKLGENWDKLRSDMSRFDIPIAMVILALVAWYLWRHYRRMKTEGG